MKFSSTILILTAAFVLTGCKDKEARSAEKKADPTFMFWCFRKEIVSTDYHIPEMKTPKAAAYIQNRLKTIPGYEGSTYDLSSQIMTVKYKSSTVRKMNFEEAIAQAGFIVNHRPANKNAKLPEGLK
jgi:copper chaperone CopZ